MTSSAYRQALAAMRKSAADAEKETVRAYAQAPGSGTIPVHDTQFNRRAMMAQENYNAKVAKRGVWLAALKEMGFRGIVGAPLVGLGTLLGVGGGPAGAVAGAGAMAALTSKASNIAFKNDYDPATIAKNVNANSTGPTKVELPPARPPMPTGQQSAPVTTPTPASTAVAGK